MKNIKNDHNALISSLKNIARMILGTEDRENTIGRYMNAMIAEQNDTFETEYEHFTAEYLYTI